MTVVLYQYWRSTASWRVRWALALKGVAFEIVPIDLAAGVQHEPTHRARSPLGTVPVLEIDGRFLTESVAIIEYLDETRPEPALLPKEPWQRARARQLVEIVNAGIQPLQIRRVKDRHSRVEAEQVAWVREFATRGLDACEQLLATVAAETGADGPFALGRELTAADLFLVPQLAHSRRLGVDVRSWPRLVRISEAAMATPHAQATRPELQPGAPATLEEATS